MSTLFNRMSAEALNEWYFRNVGYKPQEDDPSMTDDELRALCKEYEQEVRDHGLHTVP